MREQGRKVRMTSEPTDSDIGRVLVTHDDLTPETEALLFTADRACHTQEIKKWLENGFDVICDRYYASTLAYQAAAGMDIEWLKDLNMRVSMEPDITFLLDVDPEVGLDRVKKRGMSVSRYEHLEYEKQVRKNYQRIARERDFTIINAAVGPAEVVAQIKTVIKNRMES
jgi:dTMP kinase